METCRNEYHQDEQKSMDKCTPLLRFLLRIAKKEIFILNIIVLASRCFLHLWLLFSLSGTLNCLFLESSHFDCGPNFFSVFIYSVSNLSFYFTKNQVFDRLFVIELQRQCPKKQQNTYYQENRQSNLHLWDIFLRLVNLYM